MGEYFDNQIMISVIFCAEMINIRWFQPLKCDDLLLNLVKLNMFWFETVGQTQQDI